MIDISFSETEARRLLYPIAQVLPVADLRLGITTIREKWTQSLESNSIRNTSKVTIPANVLPSPQAIDFIHNNGLKNIPQELQIRHAWELNHINDQLIRSDFEAIYRTRTSAPVPKEVMVRNPTDIFIEPGASIYGCWLNAEEGPIYIGKNVLIMDGVSIRGPVAIAEGTVVKMGTRIYGGTTIGRFCTIGGEIKNSIIQDFSNKAHDGYLGDSVIGRWCNLGAGTSNSNLKNTAGDVEVWSQADEKFNIAGKKAGLYMGDYSRSAINTSFNTGTTIGVSCNVFGPGLTPAFIGDFTWGYSPATKFEFNKAIEIINNWKKLKNKTIEEQEIQILKHIFEQSLKTS
jgi:UDP-N-acetylglucosamine diphosphorylase / glucose-1-phosphate thymidylyltransferase / UDP-N-acetylgalactosamine diphosphorylase / glucosamine-1-phosphate N-acetyltransferase / galactosamine-1-phosphate N-acetyltransferase